MDGPDTNALLQLLSNNGIDLQNEQQARSLFDGLPTLHWQWQAVEDVLAQRAGETKPCPICCGSLPNGPAALLLHITSCLAASRGTPLSTVGKPFAVSASKLGSYFNSGECDRMLHRACERADNTGRVRDIEDLDKPLITAHSSRGDLFEAQICNLLCSSGMPGDWTGAAQDTTDAAALGRPQPLKFHRSGGGGQGVLRDLQEEAEQKWRASGATAVSGGLASLRKLQFSSEHEELSIEALRAAGSAAVAANGASASQMLFQPLFKAPAMPPFDNPYVSFSNSYVDFLLLRFVTDSHGRVVAELTIIDAKATGQVKIGAMVQVAYYALLLETIIASDSRLANVRDHLRVARHGGVWLYGEAAPTPFLLREVRHKVDAFLRDADGLRSFLTEQRKAQGYESQEWRLAPTCRYCGFLADCRAEALPPAYAAADAEALPPAGASGGATASVHALGLATRVRKQLVKVARSSSLLNLVALASQPQPDEATRKLLSRSLQIGYSPDGQPYRPAGGARGVISPRLTALVERQPCLTGQSSLTLPVSENVALFLTVLEDPSERSAYAWALSVRSGAVASFHSSFIPRQEMLPRKCPICVPGRSLQQEGQRRPGRTVRDFCPACSYSFSRPSPHYNQLEALVTSLHNALNAARGSSTAIFFAEWAEHALLVRLLLARVLASESGPAAAEDAAALARARQCLHVLTSTPAMIELSQHSTEIGAPERQAHVVPSHCVVLEAEAGRLVALPVAGPPLFGDVCEQLQLSKQSRLATAERLYSLWLHRFTVADDQLTATLKQRVGLIDELLNSLRRRVAGTSESPLLPREAPSLALRPPDDMRCPELSKLRFLVDCEAHAELSEVVRMRAAPLAARLGARRARTRLLRLSDDSEVTAEGGKGALKATFDVVSAQVEDLEPSKGWASNRWSEWLLVPCSPDGLRDELRFHDLQRGRNQRSNELFLHEQWSVRGGDFTESVMLASVLEVHPTQGQHGRVTLRFSLDPQLLLPPLGEYVLSPRFIDPNSRKLTERLREDDRATLPLSQLTEHLREDDRATLPLSLRLLREHPATFSAIAPAMLDERLQVLFPLTPSQEAIFCLSQRNPVQCVSGPPGSGKTYFSAALICRQLLHALITRGVQRVLVTAFTHTAIDNVLNKAAELLNGDEVRAFAADNRIELPVPNKMQFDDSNVFTVGCEVQCGTEAVRYYVDEIRESGFVIRPVGGGPEQVVGKSDIKRWRAFTVVSAKALDGVLGTPVLLLGTTVYQMPRVGEALTSQGGAKFDFLLVDEASQMLMTLLSMSLPLLQDVCPLPGRAPGRLMVVGDTKQMGPLLTEQYPEGVDGLPPVHSSVLRWLAERALAPLRRGDRVALASGEFVIDSPGASEGTYAARPFGGGALTELCCTELQQGLVSSLQENHRMCDQLAWFARDVLGYAAYQACHLCGCPCSKRWHAGGVVRGVPSLMLDVDGIDGTAADAFRSTSAFVMVEVQASSAASDAAALDEAEWALIAEAKLVADIVQTYCDGASTTWGFSAAGGQLDDSVFVVTPHHVQRVAILREIETRGIPLRRVQVATVEKMQGQERDLVVACYAGLDLDQPSELGFTYSRERLNVAVSRAKKKCVLLCSPAVLHPPMAVIETAEMRAGLELLRRIAEACGDSSCGYATRLVHDHTTATAMDLNAQGDLSTQSQSSELSPQSRRSYSQSGSQQLASQASQPSQQGGQSCGAGSQVAIDDDETEGEGEDEGAPSPLVVPILPPGETTPTGEDWDLARASLDSAATAELRAVSAELRDAALYLSVPLEARSRLRPWALVPDVDWPELVELPARMRGWARRGVAVRPVPPGRVEELESYTPALHAVAVDLQKVVAAQIRGGVLRGGG